MNKLTIVRADDWEGLYVNGVIVDQGHELWEGEHAMLYCHRILQKHAPCEVSAKWVTDEYYNTNLSVRGTLPNNLEDVELQ